MRTSAIASVQSSAAQLERRKSPARVITLERRSKSEADTSAVGSSSSAPRQAREQEGSSEGSAPASGSGASSAAAGGAGEGGESGEGGEGGSSGSSEGPTSISKRSVPDVYPQVLALPITRRPLFPGFYKAVVIRDQNVIAAINEATKRGQPYIGAFLLKDEEADSDV